MEFNFATLWEKIADLIPNGKANYKWAKSFAADKLS